MSLRQCSSGVRHAFALGDALLLQVLDERLVGLAWWIILMPFLHVVLVPNRSSLKRPVVADLQTTYP